MNDRLDSLEQRVTALEDNQDTFVVDDQFNNQIEDLKTRLEVLEAAVGNVEVAKALDDLDKWADQLVVDYDNNFKSLANSIETLNKWCADETTWDNQLRKELDGDIDDLRKEHDTLDKYLHELDRVLRGDVSELSKRIDALEGFGVLVESVSPASAKAGDTVTVVLAAAPKKEPKSVTIAGTLADHFAWDQHTLTATCKVAAGTPTGRLKGVAVYDDAQGKGSRLAYKGLTIQITATDHADHRTAPTTPPTPVKAGQKDPTD